MSIPRHCTILQARMPLRMRCPRQIRVCESCMSLRSVPSRTASRWFDSASCRAAADTLLFPCIFIVALGSYTRKLFNNSSLLHIHPLRPAIGEETCRATRQYRGLLVFQARPCSNAPYMPSLNKLCFSQRNSLLCCQCPAAHTKVRPNAELQASQGMLQLCLKMMGQTWWLHQCPQFCRGVVRGSLNTVSRGRWSDNFANAYFCVQAVALQPLTSMV